MWKLIDRKEVKDFDGFWTEYSLYGNGEKFVCVFGDSDIYDPEDGDYDAEFETQEEAVEWFECYEGYEETEDEYYADYSLNCACDNFGICAGPSCSQYYACRC